MDRGNDSNQLKNSPDRLAAEKEPIDESGNQSPAARGSESLPAAGTTPSARPRPSQILCEEPSTELVHSWIGPAVEQNPFSTPRRYRASGIRLLTRTAYSDVRKNMKSERVSRKLFMKELDEAVSEFEQTERLLRSHEYEFHQGLALLNQNESESVNTSPGIDMLSRGGPQFSDNLALQRRTPMNGSAIQTSPGIGLASLGYESAGNEIERLVIESKATFGQMRQVLESLAQMMDSVRTLSSAMSEFAREGVLERAPSQRKESSTQCPDEPQCMISAREQGDVLLSSENIGTNRQHFQYGLANFSALIRFGGILALCSVPLYFVLLWMLFEETAYRLL
jgi:hypothetical protein